MDKLFTMNIRCAKCGNGFKIPQEYMDMVTSRFSGYQHVTVKCDLIKYTGPATTTTEERMEDRGDYAVKKTVKHTVRPCLAHVEFYGEPIPVKPSKQKASTRGQYHGFKNQTVAALADRRTILAYGEKITLNNCIDFCDRDLLWLKNNGFEVSYAHKDSLKVGKQTFITRVALFDDLDRFQALPVEM